MRMPTDSHCGINFSKSSMFCDARYRTGCLLCTAAVACIVVIGDGHVLPAANQFSLSVTQKSESSWVIITIVSVIIASWSIVNCWLWAVKKSMTAEFFSDDEGVFGASKLMSVNVGISANVGVSLNVGASDSLGIGISKSLGNGNAADMTSDCDVGASGVGALRRDGSMRPRLLRARINGTRNSAGRSVGKVIGISTSSGPRLGVSDSGVGVASGVVAGLTKDGIVILGTGIVINGFLFRIISVVVAMYNGKADKIKIPNTKPGKPRNWARIR